MPQLDGLRMVAAATVIVHHYWPHASESLRLGDVGVPLFFVLSGFLITGILLRCRKMADDGLESRPALLRRFYIRRFLRIFPLYYLALSLAWVLHVRAMRVDWPWFYFYGCNFHFMLGGSMKVLGHFWSLAVEEQFYFLWPWVVLLLPRRLLVPAFIAAVLAAPLCRWGAIHIGLSPMHISMFTPSALDKLALGALLAVASDQGWVYGHRRGRVLTAALVIGLPMTVFGHVLEAIQLHTAVADAIQPLGGALVFAWIIGRASVGFTGLTGRFLAWGPVVYLGQISYGIYVYHGLMPPLLARLGLRIAADHGTPARLLMVVVAVATASLSFHFFESPINGLKRHFTYRRKSPLPTDRSISLPQSAGAPESASPAFSPILVGASATRRAADGVTPAADRLTTAMR